MKENVNIAIIGAGSMGTATASALAADAENNDAGLCRSISLWDRKPALLADIAQKHENERYLPGVKVPLKHIRLCTDPADVLKSASYALFAVPSQAFRSVLNGMLPFLPADCTIVNTAKGIENGTLLRLSEIAFELASSHPYAALSGPSHAEELGRLMPTVVTVASADKNTAERVRKDFSTDTFRIYVNDDLIGVETGGALKNIIALASGIAEGLGFGDNARAALITRGIAEISRLGVKLGAKPETFSGLSGVGDLIVTCTSVHSRNHRCGILIGQGIPPKEAVSQIGMAVEGISATEAAFSLSQKLDVRMPITATLKELLDGTMEIKEAARRLLLHGRGYENEELFLNK